MVSVVGGTAFPMFVGSTGGHFLYQLPAELLRGHTVTMNRRPIRRVATRVAVAVRAAAAMLFLTLVAAAPATAQPRSAAPSQYLLNDSHFHLSNYVQEGIDIRKFLDIMGNRVGRVALFGIPLQQTWSYGNTGTYAPTYYLQTDAPLYYYSFTDAAIAMAYKSLTKAQQARFDPASANSRSTRSSSPPRSREKVRA